LQPKAKGIKANGFLISSLLGVGFIVMAANFIGKSFATATTDLLFLPVSGILLVLAIIISVRFKAKGNFGSAYLFFAGFAGCWFSAEMVWMTNELYNQLNFLHYVNDYLYLSGYPFLLLFARYYLKSIESVISQKMLAYAFLTTIVFFIPTFYTTYSYNPNASMGQIIWAGIYPLLDAILLFPTVLGMILFFKGNVSFLWSLMFIAVLLNIIADSGFFYLDINRSYYSGSPIDILYLWSYVLFSFGIYSHIKIFKKRKMKSFDNLDELK